MSVLEGPRKESRRVLVDDAIHNAIVIDDGILLLDNGKEIFESNVVHLAPCEPTKYVHTLLINQEG